MLLFLFIFAEISVSLKLKQTINATRRAEVKE